MRPPPVIWNESINIPEMEVNDDMKRILTLVLALALAMLLTAPALAAENKFYFDRDHSRVFENDQLQLMLIRQGDCADEGTLTFSSGSPKIAAVDEYGVVTGLRKGSAVITAKLEVGKRTWTARLEVTVLRPVTEIEVDESKLPIYNAWDAEVAAVLDPASPHAGLPVLLLRAGKSQRMNATLGPKDASNRSWVLTTEDDSIVRVDGQSFVGKKAGECLVTVQSKQNPEVYTAYRALVVKPVTRVRIEGDEKTLYVGEQLMLTAEVAPADATIQSVTWKSDNESNATVDAYGTVYGVSKGSATITARATDGSGQQGTFTVMVRQQAESIDLSETAFTLKTGNYKTLRATVRPDSANDKSVTWESSDTGVAKVNGSGRVTAVKPGTAVITCRSKTHPHVYAQAVVTVYQPVTKITFTQKEARVAVGDTISLNWDVAPANATDASVTFSTNKDSILSVDQNGRVTGLRRGEAYVYATANDGSKVQGRIKVTVTQPVTGVGIQYDEVTVGVGSKVSNNAELMPADASITGMVWHVEDESIATVSGTKTKATVTGRRWGTTTVIGVTEDGDYVTTFTVCVGDEDRALKIANLYVEANDTIRIAVYNESDLAISRFYYEIELYDAWGNPLDCNDYDHSNRFEGSYNYTLYPGDATRHGSFSFGREFSRPWGIGKVVMRITGYELEDGSSHFIRERDRVEKTWEVVVLDGAAG